MKKLVYVVVVMGLVTLGVTTAGAQGTTGDKPVATTAADTESIVAQIDTYRQEGEKKLLEKKFTKKEVHFKGERIADSLAQRWEKVEAYCEGDQVIRIQLYPHPGVSERTEEFYLKGNRLVFAFIQDRGPKHEGKDTGEPGKEFYFDQGRLIKLVDRTSEGEKHPDAAKAMYETRLPYEVLELLDILNAAR
ncbi:MAG TPA: hypothetical protein PLS53_06385 [Thermoanaerobaculaceae bacterium]|nr:hypothetical protein [Thermoanaerobaculaceae bacterium]